MAKIQRAYGLGSPFKNIFPVPVISSRAPTTADLNFSDGQVWINQSSDLSYIKVKSASGSATWGVMSPGASDVDTINSLAPVVGDILIDGGTNITDSNAGNTVTLNLDAAITLATSVSSPLYTVAAATDLAITAVTGQDVIMKLGDNAAANKFSILDSDDVEVFAVDSNGGQTYTTITASGLITGNASATILTAGTALNLGSDNDAAAVNLGVGTTARTIGIGDSAAAHLINIGSVTGAAKVDILVGTGDFLLDGAATSDLIVGTSLTSGVISIGGTAQTGTMTLGDSSGTNIVQIGSGEGATTVNIAGGATAAKAVNIGVGAVANVIIMGSVSGAASISQLVGTGNFSLDGAATSTYAVGASTTSGTIAIGGTAQTGTMTLGDSSGTNIVQIGSGEGATTVAIAGGATNPKAVDIAIGAVANVVTIGTVSGAASLDLLCGTGNFTLEGNVASTYGISATGANTGIITIGGGTGAQTLNMMNSTAAKTVNIAAGAAANTVTIGSTNTTSSLVLQAGTGDITMTGTVKEINANFLYATGTDIVPGQSPIMQSAATTGVAPTGVAGDVNLMYMEDGCLMEQFIIGTQTIIAPRMSANGLSIELDNTNAEGAEYNFGARNNAKNVFVIGTDPAFFGEMQLKVVDLSGCAPLMIGFRKVEANNAVMADYTDYFCAGLNSATSATNVVLANELNSGGQTLTDSTDAWGTGDGTSAIIKVLVSASGVCTYTIDGVAPSVTNAMTFDNGDNVMVFCHFLNGADVAGEVALESLKVGFQV